MFLFTLALLTSIGCFGFSRWQRRARLQIGPAERDLASLQVGDAVLHLGDDFVVTGQLSIVDGEKRAIMHRLWDGTEERFLCRAPSPSSSSDWLLAKRLPGSVAHLTGGSQWVEHQQRRFALHAEFSGAAERVGEFGGPFAERAAVRAYGCELDHLLVVEFGEASAYLGAAVAENDFDLLPSK